MSAGVPLELSHQVVQLINQLDAQYEGALGNVWASRWQFNFYVELTKEVNLASNPEVLKMSIK